MRTSDSSAPAGEHVDVPKMAGEAMNHPAAGTLYAGSGAMFDGIAATYDRANFWLSLGMDESWRRHAVAALKLDADARALVLDVATGTADVAITCAKRLQGAHVIGVDPAARMLDLGILKTERANLGDRISLQEGDAQALSFADDSFDGVTVAFGIRNIPDRCLALREIHRVLKPEKRLTILEFSEPEGQGIERFTRWYMRRVVPRLGAWLVNAPEYAYLQASIQSFPPPDRFAQELRSSGFVDVQVKRLSFGACWLYAACKPARGG